MTKSDRMGTSLKKRFTRYLRRNGYSNPPVASDGGVISRVASVPKMALRAFAVMRGVYFDRRFDSKYGVDTSGAIYLRELEIESDNAEFGELYDPFPYRSFKHVMRALPPDVSDYTFLDYGSGKGRMLLVASDYSFKKVIGVEFSRELHKVAQSNIASYKSRRQRCFNIESICGDATTFAPPSGPLILFFFTPFRGPVLEAVLDQIKQSYERSPRKILIFFVTDSRTHPVPRDLFTKTGVMEAVDEGILPFDMARRYPVTYVTFELGA